MENFRDINLLNFLSKAISVANIFGYAIFKYPSKTFTISWFGVLTSSINILINLTISGLFIYFMSFSSHATNTAKMTSALMFFTSLATSIFTAFITIVNIFMSKKMFITFKEFEILDEEVGKNK